ncbi:hypothetical protein MRB53_037521 [Persea americana]|nr:hypothetical protein MRB53_037521 [Persea americana]
MMLLFLMTLLASLSEQRSGVVSPRLMQPEEMAAIMPCAKSRMTSTIATSRCALITALVPWHHHPGNTQARTTSFDPCCDSISRSLTHQPVRLLSFVRACLGVPKRDRRRQIPPSVVDHDGCSKSSPTRNSLIPTMRATLHTRCRSSSEQPVACGRWTSDIISIMSLLRQTTLHPHLFTVTGDQRSAQPSLTTAASPSGFVKSERSTSFLIIILACHRTRL